ncbi:pyridoxal 5'-phosphate synthase glutaminase subunit PdxT [Halalkalibacterium halodurans]|jgi:5'-phosphate synthase pdxT subunit|uniref:Pyridoxal 5'-phosphate synthase subunit PdxT n=2 Tax=Halalkalibacterium halodurans TaxID=86665 RepID=A0A0M0KB91_ALKHA|nr:pyridoxal 5'-phosphate synthase glutaminase subunit PdxT [Halalkalibacterium halodurans]MED3645736.1 pyridoxal 5'-phosphate synthase glutaminase subunit PdxT [Halalkalibacterium halodurans]TES47286.1 pyridoxal 5'-phosphate synthase glutaminase subunit PdxT [Halalkalibacterium halodurans]TPE66189.1 pyridoxal 5'-phosphate synthase glutaminase subunit PdxT [Halalkalibacterium halodurans]
MVKIGVLALQGAVREHVRCLEAPGVEVSIVKKVEQLEELDGLVFPGGESTTMRRLIDKYGFFEPLKAFAAQGKPVFGTCAGLILMAARIDGEDHGHLELMDMTVQRNAFGRQRESFETDLIVEGVGDDVRAVFIRAPLIQEVGQNVDVLSKFGDEIVVARQGHLLGCSFHPELTDDRRFHQYFVQMVKEAKTIAQS